MSWEEKTTSRKLPPKSCKDHKFRVEEDKEIEKKL